MVKLHMSHMSSVTGKWFNIKAAGADAQVITHIITIIHTTTRFGPSGRENGTVTE